MKKVLLFALTMSSFASAVSPWVSVASKRAPRAFGLLAGHGLAVAGVKKLNEKYGVDPIEVGFNTVWTRMPDNEEPHQRLNRERGRAIATFFLDKLKRIIFMRGVGMTAGHLSNNKLVDAIGYNIPFVAIPTTLGVHFMSFLPGCGWINEKIINNQYVESALWGLASGCITLNKAMK